MKKSRYSKAQIVSILKEAESYVPVPELCRTHEIEQCCILPAALKIWRIGCVNGFRDEAVAG